MVDNDLLAHESIVPKRVQNIFDQLDNLSSNIKQLEHKVEENWEIYDDIITKL